jgi:hypothetical protein
MAISIRQPPGLAGALKFRSASRRDHAAMGPNAVSVLTLLVAALELGAAGYYFCAACDQARPPRKERTSRFAIDRFIWDGGVPLSARRTYVLSHVFASIGLACLAVVALAQGPLFGGLLFAGLTALALADTFMCWRKHRRLRQPKPSPPASAP